MRTGLEASTVTPGSIAPEESFTVPAIALCASAAVGKTTPSTSVTMAGANRQHALVMVQLLRETRQRQRTGKQKTREEVRRTPEFSGSLLPAVARVNPGYSGALSATEEPEIERKSCVSCCSVRERALVRFRREPRRDDSDRRKQHHVARDGNGSVHGEQRGRDEWGEPAGCDRRQLIRQRGAAIAHAGTEELREVRGLRS